MKNQKSTQPVPTPPRRAPSLGLHDRELLIGSAHGALQDAASRPSPARADIGASTPRRPVQAHQAGTAATHPPTIAAPAPRVDAVRVVELDPLERKLLDDIVHSAEADAAITQPRPGSEQQMQPQPQAIRSSYVGAARLAGKVALISGGDSGIGRAVALHFAREGCDIGFLYLNEHEDAAETRRLVEREGRRCIAIAGDARSETLCRDAVAAVAGKLGRLDILVNNIGTQTPQDDFEHISRRQLTDTFETNVYPHFFLTRYALAHLPRGGCIINTGSVTSFRGSDHLMDYAATKGAIEALTYSLARNLSSRGIRVNGVAPGPIWTPLIASTFSPEEQRSFGSNTLMKRAGQPAEVAPAFVFLASEDASYITGQFIHVNGGGFIG